MNSDFAKVYLDNAASTPLFGEVASRYPGWLESTYANSGATHQLGYANRRAIADATTTLTDLVGRDAEVVWTSGGTESNNLALRGVMDQRGGRELIISQTEHASVSAAADAIQHAGTIVHRVAVSREGQLDMAAFMDALSPATALVSVCAVQNETGVIQNLETVRDALDKLAPKALLHVDGVQAFGRVDLPWDGAGIDLLTLAGHKIHGPPGVGCLVRRKSVRLSPILYGGGQQDNLRSGTPDVCGILAFSAAAGLIVTGQAEAAERSATLRAEVLAGAAAVADHHGIDMVTFGNDQVSPFIASFSLPGYQGAVLARLLSERGVYVGTGSACAAESKTPSTVLTAMGVDRETAYGTLRISFGHQSTAEEVERFTAELAQVVAGY